MKPGSASPRFLNPGLALAAIVSLALSLNFMRHQVISADETTQLAGLSVPVADMLAWLTGENLARFGVPADRMPPISYLLMKAWGALVGNDVAHYRSFSLVAAFAGLILFAVTLKRIHVTYWNIFVFILLAWSMNILVHSIQIRPYASFFLVGAAGCYAILRYCETRATPAARRWHIAITVIGILAAYTHFYGVIFAILMQAALAALALLERRRIWPFALATVITAASFVGLWPFFTASIGVKSSLPGANIADIPKLIYRLVASRAAAVYAPVQAALLISLAVLLTVALATTFARLRTTLRQRTEMASGTAFSLVAFMLLAAGLSVSFAGALLIKGFNALEAHYHIWMLPFLYAVFAAHQPTARTWQVTSQLALTIAAMATAISAWVFAVSAPVFIHGPGGALMAARAAAGEKAPIIYANSETDVWYFGYYPLHWSTRGEARQFLLEPNSTLDQLKSANGKFIFGEGHFEPVEPTAFLAKEDALVFAQVANFYAADAVAFIRDGTANIPDQQLDQKFAEKYGYDVVSRIYVPGYAAARIAVLRRK